MYRGNTVVRFSEDPSAEVEAFWSITVYDADSFLVASPDDYPNKVLGVCIFSVKRDTQYIKEDDGSVIIYLQHEMPERYPDVNWLCIPDENQEYQMTFRAYWPSVDIINFTYPMATVEVVSLVYSFPEFNA